MENNLIPKSLNKQKLVIIKSFTFYDLGLAIFYLAISFLITSGLSFLAPMIRVIIGIMVFALLLITLFNNKKYNMKNYQIIFFALRFLAKNKRYHHESKDFNTSLLLPYHQLVEDFIETDKLTGDKKWYIGAIEIKGFNISTLSVPEQNIRISEIKEIFKFLECPITLVKLNQPLTIDKNISYLKSTIDNNNKLYKTGKISSKGFKNRQEQLKAYITDYQEKTNNENLVTNKRFYLFIYQTSIQELKNVINLAETKIIDSGLQPRICNKYKLINTIKAIFSPCESDFKNEEIDEYAEDLKHLLSFSDINFAKDHFTINKIHYSINAVHDYPLFPRSGWGANIVMDAPAVIWNISNADLEKTKILLHKAIANATANTLAVKKIVDKSEQYYQIEAFNNLVETLAAGEETIKNCNMLFINYADNLKNLKKMQNTLNQTLRENNIKIDYLYFCQFEAFSSVLPKPTDPLSLRFAREIPAWTLASSFPFINNDLEDKNGLFMGYNVTGDLIVFNQFIEDFNRKNFNQLLLGTSGSGKSHTAKKQLNWHISVGRKVIVIDPEREYKKICQYYDGNWIDVGNGSSGNINPLQILSSLDEHETTKMIISNYLQTLEHWFSILLPDLNSDELRYLLEKITNLYQEKNIINNSELTSLKPEAFPIFDDLVALMLKTKNPSDLHQKILNVITLEFTGNGKYAQLYNNYSTLELNNNLFTVFDINSLFEKGNTKIIQAQLFLILAYIQNEVKINSSYENNELIILVDEAHLIIDKDNPVGLNFMFQMVKRIRKRRGGIILITQNPDDFVGTPEIRKKTTAMINNTQYTMILNLSPQNLIDVKEIFKAYGGLSKQECDFIAKAKRGQALFVVSGFNRQCLQIELSAKEVIAFTNQN